MKINKKFIILAVVLGVFLLPNVLAIVELRFPYNTQFDLKRACFNNGSYCSSIAQCNITVIHPSANILLDNAPMTNNVSFHNITVFQDSNNELGIHQASMACCDNGACGTDTFEIEITGDGFEADIFPLEFSILIAGLVLIVVGTTQEKLRLFKHLGAILVMVMGVVTLYPGYANINYSTLQGLALGSGSIGLGFYFLIEDSFSRDEQQEGFAQPNQKENKDLEDGRFHDND